MLISFFISGYVKLYCLPVRQLEPGSFIKLKELSPIPGFIDSHSFLLSLVIFGILFFLERLFPFKKMVIVFMKIPPCEATLNWLVADRIRFYLLGFVVIGLLLIVLPHALIVFLGFVISTGSIVALSDHQTKIIKRHKKSPLQTGITDGL
jgi:hypothetical protein